MVNSVLCDSCIHKDVCKIKPTYKDLVYYVNDYDEKYKVTGTPAVFNVSVQCTNYINEKQDYLKMPY